MTLKGVPEKEQGGRERQWTILRETAVTDFAVFGKRSLLISNRNSVSCISEQKKGKKRAKK